MTAKLSDMELIHVDPARLLFEGRHPGLKNDVNEVPDWFETSKNGSVVLAPWLRGTVLVTMEAKASKDAYFAVVSMMGVYMTEEQGKAQSEEFSNEVDSSTLDEATEEERQAFLLRAVEDMFPFVRSELYALTGRLQGVYGVMLQPHPLINSAPETFDPKA